MSKKIVFVSAYLVTLLDVGIVFSVGSIFVDVTDTFNATRAETAVIFSTAQGVGPGSGILAGLLIPKFGIQQCSILFATLASIGIMSCYLATSVWHMTVSFGIVYGLGFTNLYICSTTAISHNFTGKERLIVLSIHSTGAALGGIVYPYILTFLSSNYGFRGAMLIIGGICMNCVPGCFLWKYQINDRKKHHRQVSRHLDTEVKVEGTKIDDKTSETQSLFTCFRTILTNRYFVTYWIGSVLALTSVSLTLIFIEDMFLDKGLGHEDATLGLLLINVFNIIGRIIPGVIMQTTYISILFCPFFATLLATGVLVGLVLATSKWLALLFCALVGIPMGMLNAMFSVVSASLVGVSNLPTAMGLVFTTFGILNAVAGPLIGYSRDKLGSYEIPFYVAVGITGLGTVLLAFAFIQHSLVSYRGRRNLSV